jgi:hypothetical protein
VNCMMVDPSPLRRGRLVSRGGDSSTDGGGDSSTDGGGKSSAEEIHIRKGRLVYEGGNWEQRTGDKGQRSETWNRGWETKNRDV